MSEVKWTDSQKKAIEYHQSSVIVSAAAGSGKTAVLVERIIRMLNNTDIDRLLVVTFTQAAASQMRENIASALEKKIRSDISQEEKNLYQRQLLLLPGANISTLHSFCSRIIKENFEKAGLSPDYSLAEPDRSTLLLSQTVEQLLESLNVAIIASADCMATSSTCLICVEMLPIRLESFGLKLPNSSSVYLPRMQS